MKMIHPLTEMKIRTSKPKEKSYFLFDGGGLYLEVHPSGSKRWRYKYRIDGKQGLISLGVYPEISLPEASLNFHGPKTA